MLLVGLTGNYGMGKSTVLRMFRELGAVTIDTDEIVDGLLKDESVLEKISMAFGNDVFSNNGSLNRPKIASVIFSNGRMRDALERILHPLVFEKIDEVLGEIGRKESEAKVVVIEIPLMFERGYVRQFRRTITVYADDDVSLLRLERSGIGRDSALLRRDAQMDIKEKIARADFTIDNSGTIEETETRVKEVYGRLLKELSERHE